MKYGLNLESGLSLWTDELYGDWYRDPWGWPELQWLRRSLAKVDIDWYVTASSGKVHLRMDPKYHLTDIPKTRLGIRPAVVQDPLSRWIYLAAVGSSMEKLHKPLPEFVYGWRCRDTGRQEKNKLEWARYMETIRTGKVHPFGLQTDVTSCFASVEVHRILGDLRQHLGNTGPSYIIAQVLESHDALSGRSGVPQRSFGSAALVNVFLHPLDDLLVRAKEGGRAGVVTRWMDDIVLFGEDSRLYETFVDLQQEMRSLGLEANASKSFLTTSGKTVAAVDLENGKPLKVRLEPGPGSGPAYARPNARDLARLQRAEARMLASKDERSKSSLRKILVSLRDAKSFSRCVDWFEQAHVLPHAADSLGRYLRASAVESDAGGEGLAWGQIEEWLLDFFAQPWSRLPWVKAQFALSIPTSTVSKKLADQMENWLAESNDIQLVAVAAQRLARRKPQVCRSIVSSRSDATVDPLLQRILGLAVLTTGQSRALAQNLIRRDPTNAVLAKALDDNNWSAPPVADDFSAGET